jgi:hypothetical protein
MGYWIEPAIFDYPRRREDKRGEAAAVLRA